MSRHPLVARAALLAALLVVALFAPIAPAREPGRTRLSVSRARQMKTPVSGS